MELLWGAIPDGEFLVLESLMERLLDEGGVVIPSGSHCSLGGWMVWSTGREEKYLMCVFPRNITPLALAHTLLPSSVSFSHLTSSWRETHLTRLCEQLPSASARATGKEGDNMQSSSVMWTYTQNMGSFAIVLFIPSPPQKKTSTW